MKKMIIGMTIAIVLTLVGTTVAYVALNPTGFKADMETAIDDHIGEEWDWNLRSNSVTFDAEYTYRNIDEYEDAEEQMRDFSDEVGCPEIFDKVENMRSSDGAEEWDCTDEIEVVASVTSSDDEFSITITFKKV